MTICRVATCNNRAVAMATVYGSPFPLCADHTPPPICRSCREPMPYGDLIGDGMHPHCGMLADRMKKEPTR